MQIDFRCDPLLWEVAPHPVPASANRPTWIGDLPPRLDTGEYPIGTARKCSPLRDAVSHGYLIRLPASLYVRAHDDNELAFSWSPQLGYQVIDKHGPDQVGEGNPRGGVFKFVNPWHVRTPPGWSCLFTTPLNHQLPFRLFDGIVETDTYDARVNFPFAWTSWPHEGYLEAGTPICQVIPIYRDEWEHTVDGLDEDGERAQERESKRIAANVSHYTRSIHQAKPFR